MTTRIPPKTVTLSKWFIFSLLGGLTSLALIAGLQAADDDAEADPVPAARVTAAKKWTILHKPAPQAADGVPLSEEALITAVTDFELNGPRPGDKSLFGTFQSDADWLVSRNGLTPAAGKNYALLLAQADQFDLEGTMSAEGLGGWFFLVGWKDGHGYLIYNVTLKTSGSPWLICEFRGGKGLEPTHRELTRHVWKGSQPFRLSVVKNALNLTVGPDEVLKEVPLPNYTEGRVLMGTYNTQYGPKPIRIQALRIRSR